MGKTLYLNYLKFKNSQGAFRNIHIMGVPYEMFSRKFLGVKCDNC